MVACPTIIYCVMIRIGACPHFRLMCPVCTGRRNNARVTGQEPIRTITQQTFVEQETIWKRDNCNQRKLVLFYNL